MSVHVINDNGNSWANLALNLLAPIMTDAMKRQYEADINRKNNMAKLHIMQAAQNQARGTTPTLTAPQSWDEAVQAQDNSNAWANAFHGNNNNPWADAILNSNNNQWAQAMNRNSLEKLSQPVSFDNNPDALPTASDYQQAAAQILGSKRFSMVNPQLMQELLQPAITADQNALKQRSTQKLADDLASAQNSTALKNLLTAGMTKGDISAEAAKMILSANAPTVSNFDAGNALYRILSDPMTGNIINMQPIVKGLAPQDVQNNNFRMRELNERSRQFDAELERRAEELYEQQRQFDTRLKQQARQFGLTFDENKRQFDINQNSRDRDFYENQRQFNAGQERRANEFDSTMNENRRQFDINQDRLDRELYERQRQFDTDQERKAWEYSLNFDEGQREFDINSNLKAQELDFRRQVEKNQMKGRLTDVDRERLKLIQSTLAQLSDRNEELKNAFEQETDPNLKQMILSTMERNYQNIQSIYQYGAKELPDLFSYYDFSKAQAPSSNAAKENIQPQEVQPKEPEKKTQKVISQPTHLNSWTNGNSYNVSSGYGERTLNSITKNHKGIDTLTPAGTPITAPDFSGLKNLTVKHTGYEAGGYGNNIDVEGDYLGHKISYKFAHLMDGLQVQEGQKLEPGTLIAKTGNTGRVSGKNGGYHLHFEVKIDGKEINPMEIDKKLNELQSDFTKQQLDKAQKYQLQSMKRIGYKMGDPFLYSPEDPNTYVTFDNFSKAVEAASKHGYTVEDVLKKYNDEDGLTWR